ncbi:MAG: GAF domain-containing protein [Cyanobacteria bacterium J06643_4]
MHSSTKYMAPQQRLKKFVLKKEMALITEVIEGLGGHLCIQDEDGKYLLGKAPDGTAQPQETTEHRAAITLEEDIIGWVSGGETDESPKTSSQTSSQTSGQTNSQTSSKAHTAAKLLSRLASRELEKRTLTKELLGKYKELTLLFRLSEQIVETLDIDQIAALVLDEARQVLPSSGGMLMLLSETTKVLEQIAAFQINPADEQPSSPIKLGQGLLGKIIATNRGEIVDNVINDERYVAAEAAEQGYACHTLICVPLKIKDRLIGAIALYRTQLDPYRAEDFKLLATLGAYTASVISVLMNEKQLKESRQNELLFQLAGQIRHSLSLSDTLQTAVQKIQSAFRSDRCFFLWQRSAVETSLPGVLNQQQSTDAHIAIVSESKNPSLPTITGSYDIDEIGEDILNQIYQQQVIQIDDASQLPHSPIKLFLQGNQCEALLAFPMMTRTGQVGLLCCATSQPRHWEPDQVKLLQTVTNQLIIAIDQAELYEKSQSAARLAQDKAHELQAAIGDLQAMQLKLVHTEKMSSLGRMVAGIAHEINNPVTFIHGNLGHLHRGVTDLLDLLGCYTETYPEATKDIQEITEDIDLDFLQDDLPKLLESMNTGTARIQEIVLSLQNFIRLDQADMKPVNLHEGLDSALLLLQHRFNSKTRGKTICLVKNYGKLPKVECYAKQINQVFMNLLNNALDALEKPTNDPPTITITTRLEDQQVIICIADNGPGISPKAKEHLFDPFFTTKDVGQGKGLGLSMSHQIVVDQHRGHIDCISTVGRGTELIIKLPLAQPQESIAPVAFGSTEVRQKDQHPPYL